MSAPARPLRIGFVAGTLGLGGAEKQAVYMARALHRQRVEVRCFSLTRGGHHEASLLASGVGVEWVGPGTHPLGRAWRLAQAARHWGADILQSTLFYTNLHVALGARAAGALAVGAIRNDLASERRHMRAWSHLLYHAPHGLVANSMRAIRHARDLGWPTDRVHLLPNVIDPDDMATPPAAPGERERPVVVLVARLVPDKRMDRFLRVLAAARATVPALGGIVVGEGPERARLEEQARALGLAAGDVEFVGQSIEMGQWLRRASVAMLTSDHEGSPNVILEAMAAGLPVVTTAVGDAPELVIDGETGWVIPADDEPGLVRALARVAGDARLAARAGEAGRQRARAAFSAGALGDRLLEILARIARDAGRAGLAGRLGAQRSGAAGEAAPLG